MGKTENIVIRMEEKPARKVVLKRGRGAAGYWQYCEEVGCDVWGILTGMKDAVGEPVCLWLPPRYREPDTSEYVQGAEVPADYAGEIPEGFDLIELPACKYLRFQGEPFGEDDFGEAVQQVLEAVKKYDPRQNGLCWDPENPRIQLEPIGARGYVELYPVKSLQKSPEDS